jgi:hypothetical protein
VDEANSLARRIGRNEPQSVAGLLVRFDALAYQLVEVDDAIIGGRGYEGF